VVSESREETEFAAAESAATPQQTDSSGADQPEVEGVLPGELPPVKAPSAGFLVQLFLIPMIIVSIIVMVWVLFSWIAHMGTDPRDLVRDLRSLNKASWQKAFTLSDLLRDPSHPELKRDEKLARELADVLDAELQAGSMEPSRIRLRVFLCKCLGEFELTVGLPQLLEAARLERSSEEVDVRYAAFESLAVLAENVGAEKMQQAEVMKLLTETTREYSDETTQRNTKGELRSVAVFTLGVIGGDEALELLHQMLGDPHPNARYNAALGMARHGDLRCGDVLMTMLTPDNPDVVQGEESVTEKEAKRLRVIVNAIRAVGLLSEYHRADRLKVLHDQLRKLSNSDLPSSVRLEAKETLTKILP
jgi:HEAT repeat protein